MYARILLAVAMVAVTLPAGAQELTRPESVPNNDVTFEVPINLTQLARDIRQIDVTCYLTSDAITVLSSRATNPRRLGGNVVLDVGSGRLVTTANVVVAVPADRLQDPAGKTFNWECSLTGYTTGTRLMRTTGGYAAGWDFFSADHVNPSYRLSPTPKILSGSFVW